METSTGVAKTCSMHVGFPYVNLIDLHALCYTPMQFAMCGGGGGGLDITVCIILSIEQNKQQHL